MQSKESLWGGLGCDSEKEGAKGLSSWPVGCRQGVNMVFGVIKRHATAPLLPSLVFFFLFCKSFGEESAG